MRTFVALRACVWTAASLAVLVRGSSAADELPQNLAPRAKVSASSQFSGAFRPEMAISGAVPSDFLQDQDWAMRAVQCGHFTLEWSEPIDAAQIIYYARVTSPLLECFKDYEVYLNDDEQPCVRGTLEQRRGPQSISFPPRKVTKIRLEFLSAYPDSPNPGAAEIAVYPVPVSDKQLAEMAIPSEEKTPEAQALRRELLAGELGFRDILLVKRKPLNISHVYVYHVEGFRPGGGLYIFSPNDEGGELKCIFDAGEGHDHDGRSVVRRQRGGLCHAAGRSRRLEPRGPHRRHFSIRRRDEQLPSLQDQHRRQRSDAVDPRQHTTTSTPAGCPTAGSPSSPTANRPMPTATSSPRRFSTAWTATARTRSGYRPIT